MPIKKEIPKKTAIASEVVELLKLTIPSVPSTSKSTLCECLPTNLKFQFTISGLKKYAYEHAPVKSMSGRGPVREIITIQPLKNLYDPTSLHNYYLTYTFYKTDDSFNGSAYLTCDYFASNSTRGGFTVTSRTTEILSSRLFGKQINNAKGVHSEPLYILNNFSGTQVLLTLSILDGEYVTLTT